MAKDTSETTSGNEMDPNLWYFYGKGYDLAKRGFLNPGEHPGGEFVLRAVKGRECSILLETVHAPFGKIKAKKLLESFGAPEHQVKFEPVFEFKEDGLYAEICEAVKERFKKDGIKDYKSTNAFWVFIWILALVNVYSCYHYFVKGSPFYAAVFAFSNIGLGFSCFHTAGHQAQSKNPRVNYICYYILGNVMGGFFTNVWDGHHNYLHHAYTSIPDLDPDTDVGWNAVRKHDVQGKKPIHRIQRWFAFVYFVLFPGYWFLQVGNYLMAPLKHKIYGQALTKYEYSFQPSWCLFFAYYISLISLSLCLNGFLATLVSTLVYCFMANFSYWAFVFPNHDVEGTDDPLSNEVKNKKRDWAEQQIRGSANFDSRCFLLSWFMGGLDYQIEHHLFPSIHSIYYPVISEVIRPICKKHGIPYLMYPSWFHSLLSNMRKIKSLAPLH